MINRQKKLTLTTPYHKISRVLWQNKRVNTEKEKENLLLKTKLNQLSKHQNIKEHHATSASKIQQKYQKLVNKCKEQAQWIKQTNQTIEERKYEQMKLEIKKIENLLNKNTQKTITAEIKLKKSIKKMKNIQSLEKQYINKYKNEEQEDILRILENQKRQVQTLLSFKQDEAKHSEQRNKELNKQLIQLLNIKNILRNQLKESKDKDKALMTAQQRVFQIKPNCNLTG